MRKIMVYIAMVWSVFAAIPCWSTLLKVESWSKGHWDGMHQTDYGRGVDSWVIEARDECEIYDIQDAEYYYSAGGYWTPVQRVAGLGTSKLTLWVFEGSWYKSSGWKGNIYVRCHNGGHRSTIRLRGMGMYKGISLDFGPSADVLDSLVNISGGQLVTAEVNDLNFSISNNGCSAYQTIGRASSDIASLTGRIVRKPSESSIQLEMASSKSGGLQARVCNTGAPPGHYSWMVTATLAMQ
ncbi:Uncharacterised protein [Edwardsiella tarda]|nr:Uncharacterised protein [Edwardsiella tarda]